MFGFKYLSNHFSLDLGIDLGTANTLVYAKGKGIVLREPSVVAIDQETNKPLAVGEEAKLMLGRTPQGINAIRPLKAGVIAELKAAQAMISYFIAHAHRRNSFYLQTRMVIGVPSGITGIEENAVMEAAENAGAGFHSEVILIKEPLAAAIGAGLPVLEPRGTMIVDIGGGTTEVAVLSLGRIVLSESLRIAGDEITEAIIQYIRKEHDLVIGERTAEAIKIQIGGAYPRTPEMSMEVRGVHLKTGLPRSEIVTSSEIREAIQEPIKAILECVRKTLEKTPPEMAADIIDRGIVLAGGGALLYGLDELLQEITEVPVHVAEDPLSCVVLGAGKFLEEFSSSKQSNWKRLLGVKQL